MRKKKAIEPIKKPAIDAILVLLEKTIGDIRYKIYRRSSEINSAAKLQRADRYVLHELLRRKRDYIADIKKLEGAKP